MDGWRMRPLLTRAFCLIIALGCGCEPTPEAETSPAAPETTTGEVQPGDEPQDTPGHTNRLADETSPYLLLHAHNPVDWYPWGEEAFEKARREGKLIFLSIGYSSCYWCHVMERESFMDEEIAALLNEHFVAIKVDREERPDVDEIYMTALQIYQQATGAAAGGGWPLNMFLTADGAPVLGGTYFPPRDSERGTGLLTVLTLIRDRWQENPDELKQSAAQLAGYVRDALRRRPIGLAEPLDAAWIDEVAVGLAEQYDPRYGGFGYVEGQPQQAKFPQPSNLLFLLDREVRTGDAAARDMLMGTLDAMAAGGIRDHLGGGFHRYSTDRFWHIPHFEKMLYDNAQLLSVYSEAAVRYQNVEYARVAREMAEFVLREMTDTAGGFYSALDAETDTREGAYYAWSDEELSKLLSPEEMALMAAVYGIEGEPNFEEGHVLLRSATPAEVAAARGVTETALHEQIAAVRARLLAARDQRERPLCDTKVLTAWNGLMIEGLANAGRLLDEPRYIDAARRAASFALAELRTADGRLLRTWRDGQAKLQAYLDDYAFLVAGLLALESATGEERWLAAAVELTDGQLAHFWDDEHGGFFFTADDHEQLIARSKDPVDSALPSGNAVSAANLVALAQRLQRADYLDRARETIATFRPLARQAPLAVPWLAIVVAALGGETSTEQPAAQP